MHHDSVAAEERWCHYAHSVQVSNGTEIYSPIQAILASFPGPREGSVSGNTYSTTTITICGNSLPSPHSREVETLWYMYYIRRLLTHQDQLLRWGTQTAMMEWWRLWTQRESGSQWGWRKQSQQTQLRSVSSHTSDHWGRHKEMG